MNKYIDADKLIKAIEEKGLDCSFALKMERLDTLALIDSLQQEQPSEDLEKAANNFALCYDNGTCDGIAQDCFCAGEKWQKEQVIGIIESRISEIMGDAQPNPTLRAELRDLINKLKEGEK